MKGACQTRYGMQDQLAATRDQLAAARLEVSSLQLSVASTKKECAEAQAAEGAARCCVDEAHAAAADIQRGFEERLEAARVERNHSDNRTIAARKAGEDAIVAEKARAGEELEAVAQRHARELESARAEAGHLAKQLGVWQGPCLLLMFL
jgi:hypothetical protein